MQINVAQQLKGSVGNSRGYCLDGRVGDGSEVHGDVKLIRTDRSILVTGRFSTVSRCNCCRCLEELKHRLEFTIEEEFFPTRDVLSGFAAPVRMDRDNDYFLIGEDHILDLSEAVRQGISLNLPTNPVCQDNCAGLCHSCGHNLNNGSCACPKEDHDIRWSPLKTLLSE